MLAVPPGPGAVEVVQIGDALLHRLDRRGGVEQRHEGCTCAVRRTASDRAGRLRRVPDHAVGLAVEAVDRHGGRCAGEALDEADGGGLGGDATVVRRHRTRGVDDECHSSTTAARRSAGVGEAAAVVGRQLVLGRETGAAGAELVATLEVHGHVLADGTQDHLVAARHLDGVHRWSRSVPPGWRCRNLVGDADRLDDFGCRARVADLESAELPLAIDLVVAVGDEVVRTGTRLEVGPDHGEHVHAGQRGVVGHRRAEGGEVGEQRRFVHVREALEGRRQVDGEPRLDERDVLRLGEAVGGLRLRAQHGRERHRNRHGEDAADHDGDQELRQREAGVASGDGWLFGVLSRLRHL